MLLVNTLAEYALLNLRTVSAAPSEAKRKQRLRERIRRQLGREKASEKGLRNKEECKCHH